MAKMGVRQKAQTLQAIQESLRKEAPLCTLAVASTDPADPFVYSISYNNGFARWRIGRPEDKVRWHWRTNTRGNDTSDVSEQVLEGLQRQHDRALKSMDEFYSAAVKHLAPQLVMDVLDGRNPSFRETFKKEVVGATVALEIAIRKAGASLTNAGYNFEATHKLYSHSQEICRVYLYSSGKITLGVPPVMTYLLLPQVAQHVSLFIAGLKAMTAALPREQETGFTIPG